MLGGPAFVVLLSALGTAGTIMAIHQAEGVDWHAILGMVILIPLTVEMAYGIARMTARSLYVHRGMDRITRWGYVFATLGFLADLSTLIRLTLWMMWGYHGWGIVLGVVTGLVLWRGNRLVQTLWINRQ